MSAFIGKHWFMVSLALGVAVAMVAPTVVRGATDFLEPRWTVAVSLFLMAWTMPTASLLREMRSPSASLYAVLLSYGFVPLAGWVLGFLAPTADVRVGLILVSAVPCTLASAILWTRLAGGNEACALLTVMGTTFTSWFATTAWLYGLTGTDLQLDAVQMMRDLVLSLIAPVLIGQLVRWMPSGARVAERNMWTLGVVSQAIILAIVMKAGVVVGDELHKDALWEAPAIFVASVVLAVALHLVALVSGLFSCRWLGFNRGRQIAVAFSASQKTLPVSLMLYEQFFKDDYPFAVLPLLFYHVGQLLLDTVIAKRLAQSPPPISARADFSDSI